MEKDTSGHGLGRARPKEEWIGDAQGAVLNLLDEQYAVPHAELEARLCDRDFIYQGARTRLSPHILSEAIRRLIALEVIKRETVHPRNHPKPVELLVPTNRWKRT